MLKNKTKQNTVICSEHWFFFFFLIICNVRSCILRDSLKSLPTRVSRTVAKLKGIEICGFGMFCFLVWKVGHLFWFFFFLRKETSMLICKLMEGINGESEIGSIGKQDNEWWRMVSDKMKWWALQVKRLASNRWRKNCLPLGSETNLERELEGKDRGRLREVLSDYPVPLPLGKPILPFGPAQLA